MNTAESRSTDYLSLFHTSYGIGKTKQRNTKLIIKPFPLVIVTLTMKWSTVYLPLRNREGKHVLLDESIYNALKEDSHLTSIKLFDKLRAHSKGYAFMQRYVGSENGRVKMEAIYLHRLIAERFLTRPDAKGKLSVHFKDGNPLNLRLNNLEWLTFSQLRREMKSAPKSSGYRGVTKDRGRFRVIIYENGKAQDLGFFEKVEEAALAYNRRSIELYGVTGGLNDIDFDPGPYSTDLPDCFKPAPPKKDGPTF